MTQQEQFITWLNGELDRRGWSRSEAARRGEVSASMMDKVIGGFSNPGIEFCKGVSRAFKMPLEEVFRLAGILPDRGANGRPVRDKRGIVYEIDGDAVLLAKYHALSGDDQALVQDLMERLGHRESRIIGDETEE